MFTRPKNKVHRVKSIEHWKNKQYRLQFDIKILFVNVKPTVVTYDLFQATVLNLQNICAPSIRRHGPLEWPHKYRCSLIVSSATNFPHHRIPLPCHIHVRTRSSLSSETVSKTCWAISQDSLVSWVAVRLFSTSFTLSDSSC